MTKYNRGLKLPNLDDVLKLNPLTVVPKMLVIDAITLMNQFKQSYFKHNTKQKYHQGIACSSYVLVLEHLQIVGVLTERDIVKLSAKGTDLTVVTVAEVMTTKVITLNKSDFRDIYQIMSILNHHQIRHLPIVNDLGQLEGIITLKDIVKAFDTREIHGVISTLKQKLNQQTKYLQREIEQCEKSKKVLQENQRLLELFVYRTPAAIAMLDREMRYLAVSNRWIEDYQLKDHEIIGLTHYEVFPEISQRWKQDHQNCLSGKVKVLKREEDSFVRPDGRVDWLRWELRPWHNQEGEIAGLLMFSEVITEKKRLKQQLHSSEAQMRAMFKAMSDLVFTIDITNNSIQILPTKFLDISNPNVWQQIQEDIFNGVEAQRYRNLNQKILQTQQTFEFEYSLKLFDSWICFSVNVSAVSPTIVMWVARNISHRKQIEQNLFAEKELAQITLKSIGDAVITTDALGKVTYLNPIAEQLTGWTTTEVKGKLLRDFFQIVNQLSQQPVVNPIDLALKENRICELSADTLLIARDGNQYAIEDSAAPIHDRQRKLIGAVMVFHDVTQSRNLAQELSWQATHDPLTGLYNRRKFEEEANAAIKDAHNQKTKHALCYLDLDRLL